jgi:hypothetical protein
LLTNRKSAIGTQHPRAKTTRFFSVFRFDFILRHPKYVLLFSEGYFQGRPTDAKRGLRFSPLHISCSVSHRGRCNDSEKLYFTNLERPTHYLLNPPFSTFSLKCSLSQATLSCTDTRIVDPYNNKNFSRWIWRRCVEPTTQLETQSQEIYILFWAR